MVNEMMGTKVLGLPITVRRIKGTDRYSVRMGGSKIAEVRRDAEVGWDWVECAHLDDDATDKLIDIIHYLIRSTPDQIRNAYTGPCGSCRPAYPASG